MSQRWIPGAVSATFRNMPLSVGDILDLLASCRLQTVEWSENAHIAPDDPAGAAALYRRTSDAGLTVAAYGSYYRLGEQEGEAERTFLRSLRSAAALHAPVIRIWGGSAGSAGVDEATRACLTREAALVARIAAEEGIRVALEWHKNTLTDINESARRLLEEAEAPNLYCLWQPTVALTPRERTEGIRLMGDRLLNFHVYSWPDGKRGPLNAAEWQYYLDAAAGLHGERALMLEFVRDDSPDQFRADAAVLVQLTESENAHG